jgi:hypothetical protein
LVKPSFGMSIFAVISRSAALSRPMPRERCAGLLSEDAAFLIAEQLSPLVAAATRSYSIGSARPDYGLR